MKKVLKTIAAIPVAAGLLAVPAIAADQLDLSGEMRTRAWFISPDEGDDISFFDHRLRMYGKFLVNDNVQVHFRTDLSEATWGSNNSTFGAGRQPVDKSMQVDRAFFQLENDSMRFRGGLQNFAYTPSYTIDSQDEGLLLTFKNDVARTSVFWILDGSDAFSNEIFEEQSIYGFLAEPSFGAVNGLVFGTYETDGDDFDVWMLGASATGDAGIATITAEIDFFGGEVANEVDAKGIQGFIQADFKIDDMWTVSPLFVFAGAASADEQQVTFVGNGFNGWDPLFAIGVGMDNEKIGLGKPYDFTGTGAGAIGGALLTTYKVSDALSLGAAINYITTDDDDIFDEELFGAAVGAKYSFMGNAQARIQLEYHSFDVAGDAVLGGVYLGVSF